MKLKDKHKYQNKQIPKHANIIVGNTRFSDFFKILCIYINSTFFSDTLTFNVSCNSSLYPHNLRISNKKDTNLRVGNIHSSSFFVKSSGTWIIFSCR